MILEDLAYEIWGFFAALIVIAIYPILKLGIILFDFINIIYKTVKLGVTLGLVLIDGVLGIFDHVMNNLFPTPIVLVLIIIAIFVGFTFITRWTGKIEILGFKFGG